MTNGAVAVLPPFLQPGDTIGLFSPAGPVRDATRVEAGRRILRDLGFHLKTMEVYPPAAEDYLAAGDEDRLHQLNALWADDSVRALWAVRGGYGCLRLADRLDQRLLRAQPKLLIGFSDLTVLLNLVRMSTGLITIHGPVLSSLATSDKESIHNLFALLSGKLWEYKLPARLEVLRGGMARGLVHGGNLTTISHLLATPWDIPWDNTILVLEDVGEPPYKLDRMLTQLYAAGKLERLAGLILGDFSGATDDALSRLRLREMVWQRVLQLTSGTQYPIWGNFPCGHGRENYPLFIGMEAVMDSANSLFRYYP